MKMPSLAVATLALMPVPPISSQCHAGLRRVRINLRFDRAR